MYVTKAVYEIIGAPDLSAYHTIKAANRRMAKTNAVNRS